MSTPASRNRSRTVWIVVIVLGAAAVLLGLWDAFVERDGGESCMTIALGAGVIGLGVHGLRQR